MWLTFLHMIPGCPVSWRGLRCYLSTVVDLVKRCRAMVLWCRLSVVACRLCHWSL